MKKGWIFLEVGGTCPTKFSPPDFAAISEVRLGPRGEHCAASTARGSSPSAARVLPPGRALVEDQELRVFGQRGGGVVRGEAAAPFGCLLT